MDYLKGGYMPEGRARETEREAKPKRKRRKKDCTKNASVHDMITLTHICKIILSSANVKRKKI